MSASWQEKCTAELKRHIDLGVAGEAAWGVRRWELFEQAQKEQGPSGRVIIADLDASGDRLRRYSFFSCYLTRCNFSDSDLSGADFELAILRDCNFSGANLERSTFQDADVTGSNQFLKVTTQGRINFAVVKGDLPRLMDDPLVQMARREWAIKDDHLHEGWLIRNLRRVLGYGLKIRNVGLASLAVVGFFSVLWMFSPLAAGEPILMRLGQSVLCSLRYFVGITEVFDTSSGPWAYVGLFETALGLLLLAILIAALSKRLTIAE